MRLDEVPVARRRRWRVGAGAVLLVLLWPLPTRAAGPWEAQVVDVSTRAPLAGVAVLARWHRRAHGHPAIGLGRTGFHAAAEATTGADGRFRLPARVFFSPPPFFPIEGPEIALFKAGYGGWALAGPARDLTGPGVVFEMRPLATTQERVSYLEGRWSGPQRQALASWQHGERPANPFDMPYEAAPRYEAAINAERAARGLRPIGVGFPGLATTYAGAAPSDPPGQVALRQPAGVAVDAKGHVYVADTDHHRIVKLGPDLGLLATWGTFGRGDGQLQFPRSVAVDGDTVYVADWGNHRVQRFTTDGRFLAKWGELRYDDLGSTFTPTVVATTRAGEIFVYTAGRIYRFTPAGSLVAQWGKSLQFSSRSQVAVDGDGNVYGITGQHGLDRPQVVKFDRDGTERLAWGRQGHGVGELFDPIGLAVDHSGRVYVGCWGGGTNPRIVVFEATGAFVHQWDVKGGSLPALRRPSGLAVDVRGSVYVTDLQHPRVLRLSPPGR